MDVSAIIAVMHDGAEASLIGTKAAQEMYLRRHPGGAITAGDVDLFHPSMEALMFNVSYLLNRGAVPLSEQEERKIARWIRWGAGDWETNSVRLEYEDEEFNLVYKLQGRKPLRTIIEQICSFDFSCVSMGWNTRTGQFVDLFPTLWPGQDPDRVRMFPEREDQWRTGSIGKHTGLRQAGRYAKYATRGYDMELCKEPLVEGYRIAAAHYADKDDAELKLYSDVYLALADLIEADDIAGLTVTYESINPYSRIESMAEVLA